MEIVVSLARKPAAVSGQPSTAMPGLPPVMFAGLPTVDLGGVKPVALAGVLVALAVSEPALGSGLGLGIHGARLQGAANSGGAVWTDPSALSVSPAASIALDGVQWSVDAHAGEAQSRFVVLEATDGAGDPLPPLPQTVRVDNRGLLPQFYGTMRLAPQWSAGLALTVPYGTDVWLDDTFAGRLYGAGMRLSSLQLTPSIAWQVTDGHGVGFGPRWQRLEAETLRYYSLNGLSGGLIASTEDASVLTRGEDDGWGYQAGYAWTPSASTRVSLAWASAIRHRLEGSAAFVVPQDAPWQLALSVSQELRDGVESSVGWVDITTAESLSCSVMQMLDVRWTLQADLTWTRNSRLDEVRLSIPTPEDPLRNVTLALDWRDTWTASVGAERKLSDRWVVRSGVMFDQGPVRDAAHSLPAVADRDRWWLATGASLQWGPDQRIDLSLAFFRVENGRFDRVDDDDVASNGSPGVLRGHAGTDGWLAGFQYNHRWP
jgi:long-chain fatty acid transport protein